MSSEQVAGVETYLYDFTGEVYDKEIVVELLAFKRAEVKFDNIEALKSQMQKDIAEGAVYHKEVQRKDK